MNIERMNTRLETKSARDIIMLLYYLFKYDNKLYLQKYFISKCLYISLSVI
jgi:hypothetical protein